MPKTDINEKIVVLISEGIRDGLSKEVVIKKLTEANYTPEEYRGLIEEMICPECNANWYVFTRGKGCENCKRIHENIGKNQVSPEKKRLMDVANRIHFKHIYTAPKTTPTPDTNENLKFFLGVIFTIFLVWMLFGGLLEEKGSSNSVYIDCTKPGNESFDVCNGDYEMEMNETDFRESSTFPQR